MAFANLFPVKLQDKLAAIFASRRDKGEVLAELEEQLLLADIAMPVAERLIAAIARKSGSSAGKVEYTALLRGELLAVFPAPRPPLAAGRQVLLLVGVNGSGKTTSAAKLARFYQQQGRRVLLAAADTFRAAGSSQLCLWAEKLNLPVIGGERGADPGSIVFNSMRSWQEKGFDLLVIDTAGRMQSKEQLMHT